MPDYVRRSIIEAQEREQTRLDYAAWVDEALRRGCRYCHADVGQPCTNKLTGRALEHYAHPQRLSDAI